jgi:hypothetical protein
MLSGVAPSCAHRRGVDGGGAAGRTFSRRPLVTLLHAAQRRQPRPSRCAGLRAWRVGSMPPSSAPLHATSVVRRQHRHTCGSTRTSLFAPASSSRRMHSTWPLDAATYMAVVPFCAQAARHGARAQVSAATRTRGTTSVAPSAVPEHDARRRGTLPCPRQPRAARAGSQRGRCWRRGTQTSRHPDGSHPSCMCTPHTSQCSAMQQRQRRRHPRLAWRAFQQPRPVTCAAYARRITHQALAVGLCAAGERGTNRVHISILRGPQQVVVWLTHGVGEYSAAHAAGANESACGQPGHAGAACGAWCQQRRSSRLHHKQQLPGVCACCSLPRAARARGPRGPPVPRASAARMSCTRAARARRKRAQLATTLTHVRQCCATVRSRRCCSSFTRAGGKRRACSVLQQLPPMRAARQECSCAAVRACAGAGACRATPRGACMRGASVRAPSCKACTAPTAQWCRTMELSHDQRRGAADARRGGRSGAFLNVPITKLPNL